MHVDTSHKVMFCNIAKVGSTVWGRALAMLVSNLTGSELQEKAGQYHVVERNPSSFIHREINTFGVNTTKTWTTTMWQDNKRDYYKIMFVRDPFDRLKSAYRDKFLIHDSRTTSYYTGHVGKLIRRRYRDVKSNNPHLEVTFEEFLRYVLDEYKNGNTMDNHWRRYVDRCDPCGIHYDFIGHIETMAEDAEYLFGEVFHSNLNVTETLNPSHGPSATAHELTHPILHSTYYNGITKSVIRGIRDYLSVDAKLFGFDINKQLRTKVSKDHNAVTNSWYVYFPMQWLQRRPFGVKTFLFTCRSSTRQFVQGLCLLTWLIFYLSMDK